MTMEREHGRCGHAALAAISAEEHAGGHEHGAPSHGRTFAFAGTPRNFERDRPFETTDLDAALELDFARKTVAGRVRLRCVRKDQSARTLKLDAIAFDISRVLVAGQPAEHVYDGKVISIEMPPGAAEYNVDIGYEVQPERGLYFIAPDELYPHKPLQAWTQCQEEDARYFLPCHDKPHVKMRTRVQVTVPEGFQVLGNGHLESAETASGKHVAVWSMREPIATYLFTLVAGKFAQEQDEALGIPLSYWVPEHRRGDIARTFGRTKEMLRCFSETFGVAYPWNKYAQVVVSDFIFGGMENTTATTLTEHVLIDERAALDADSDDLIAHELAHQWFGDYVTCRDWSEGWLNEGFATFAEHLFRGATLGRDAFHFGLRTDLDSYLNEAKGRYQRPIVCQEYDAPLDLFDRHLYEKGALALHVLRVTLGEGVFREAVGAYLRKHAHGVVETRDLLRAMEERSGRSLGKLFEQLLYKPGHPRIAVTLRWDDGILFVAAKQTQSGGQVPEVFEFPLELQQFHQGRGAKLDSESMVLTVTERTQSFAVPCPVRPLFIVVDEQMGILGELSVKAPLDMLVAQARRAESARGRWLALTALAYESDPKARKTLEAALADEQEFWGARVVAAESLGAMGTPWALSALCSHAQTKHPKVRRAVATALGEFRAPAAAMALSPLAQRDPSYLVCAAAARALGKTGQAEALPVLLEIVDLPSWADVIAAGALDGLAALRDEQAAPHVVARLALGRSTRVRRAAATALPKLATDRAARVALEQMLTDADPYLRIDVVRALVELGDLKCRAALNERLARDLDPRVRRRIREALRELGEGDKKRTEALEDRVAKLTDEVRALRDRVLTLEARPEGTPAGEVRSKDTSKDKASKAPAPKAVPATKATTATKAKAKSRKS